jgi:hypothetical protein
LKKVLQETALALKGSSRRRFMAQIVIELGYGGQKLNQLGYYPQRVAKTQPQKKFPKPMTSLNNCLSSTN